MSSEENNNIEECEEKEVNETEDQKNEDAEENFEMSSSLPDYYSGQYFASRAYIQSQMQSSIDNESSKKKKLKPKSLRAQKLEGLKMQIKEKEAEKKEPLIIGVAGGSASGKTTVCKKIMEKFTNAKGVAVISQDSFYKPLDEASKKEAHKNEYNFDHPDAFDYDLLIDTVKKLKEGKAVQIPVYDFTTHSRTEQKITVLSADVIILEGILIFWLAELRDLMNIKIFVEEDADIRLARRIKRDIVERGRDVNGILNQYEKFVKPSFEQYILPTKRYADVIIPRGGDNFIAIHILNKHIESVIEEKQKTIDQIFGN